MRRLLVSVLALLILAPPAEATFPGRNGSLEVDEQETGAEAPAWQSL